MPFCLVFLQCFLCVCVAYTYLQYCTIPVCEHQVQIWALAKGNHSRLTFSILCTDFFCFPFGQILGP